MSTKSPAFKSCKTFSHKPSVRNVRLLRPARARLRTFIFDVSKKATNGSPQPLPPFALLLAVESPTTKSVGSFGLAGRCIGGVGSGVCSAVCAAKVKGDRQ